MSTIYHNRSVILQILLIAWVLGSSSIVIGQSPEIQPPAPDSSTEPLPPVPASSPYRQPSIRKFTFKHAKAGDVLKLLQQLEPEQKESSGFAVDERTNSFLFQLEDDQQARTFEELCTLLDEEANVPSHVGNGVSISIPVNGQQPQVFSFSMGFERGESLESLKKRYRELEQQTHQLADKLKQSKPLSEPGRTELKTAVRKSFEARQTLQRAELADLAQRMKSMQQSIDMRDKLVDKVIERRVEDLLDPNLKWEVTRTSNESTRSISKEDSINQNTITSSQEMQAALQGTWNVRAFQAGDQGDDRLSQVVIRGDLLLMHTIVNEKVLGVSPWKLVWPNAERPYELGVIWDPNSNAESNSEPARIAYDGKSFQLAWGENPNAICPGENIAYIDCVRANIDDRSAAAQATYQAPSQVSATSSATGHTKSDASRQPVAQAINELITQLHFEVTQTPPFSIVVGDIEVTAKEDLGDFKEVIQEQITAELKAFAHLNVISRRSAEAAIHSARIKWKDVVIPDRRAKYVEELKKEGHTVDLILSVKLVGTENPTEYLLALELMDRGGRSHKSSATISLPETSTRFMKQRVQGNWIVESLSAEAKDGLLDQTSPLVLSIDGETLSLSEAAATPLDMQWRGLSQSSKDDQPVFAVDFVLDPNGERVTAPGILSCDGEVLRICYCTSNFDNLVNDAFRPDRFLAGSKVNLFTCRRSRAATPETSELRAVDLSTPQATLDTIDRYSVDHPMGFPVECYTEAALQELSGVMLQQLCFMSGLSQVGLQTGGVIGIKDNAPIVAGTAPSFHLSVDALLKEHSLPTPPEECTKAFELLAKLTLGAAFGNGESRVKPDRELFRLAAGTLKSPKEFLRKAGELSERFNNIPGDTESPKKESKAQPKYLIEIDGDEATATQIVDTDKPSVPMSFKLQRIDQRWLVSEAFSDEILHQMISSMSSVLDGVSASEGNTQGVAESSHPTIPPPNNSDTPQELLDAVEQHGKSGSYEDFVTLFNDEGVRDLAGSLLMSAMMQTSMDELARQQTTGGLAEVHPGTVAVRKVLQRWLPQSLSADQREYVGKGLSTMMSSIGGASPDQAALKEFVISMRKSVEGITDHRKFCVEMMQGYEKLTTKPFVYFGNADQKNEWQISQFGDRAIATLIDGSPGMATTITLQQASGDWRISSLFNEFVEMTKEDESVARPITPAMEMQQRLQGEWDVKVMGYSPDMHVKQPYQAVVRGQLFLLQCMEDGKVIGTSTWKMIWPEADHPDVVDIVWDPNNNSDEYCAPGRITCDGKSFQVAWRSDDSISGPAIRPTEFSSGDGISYFECVRKQPADPSPTSTSSDATVGPKYSGHPISWWLDSYWDNATAIPKTAENAAQEYVASEAIRKLREKPECKAAIEAALAKWFASVEHEVNEIQLVRAAKCFVVAAGTEHQELAVAYLFKIWRQLPTLTLEKQIELASDQNDETELNALLKQLVLNDELAIQFAERLTNGTSSDRAFVTYYLFSSTGLKDEKDPKVAELNTWLHNHRELFIPAFAAALKDESEHVRWFSLSSLIGLDLKHANVLSTLTSVIESDASPKVRWLAVEMLSSKEMLSVANTQNIEIAPLMIKTLESDSSVDVRYAALGALMAMDKDSELVHATLLEWTRCKERLQVENALSLMLRNHEAGDRPQSIDELIELLSDLEWGTKVEVNYNIWSTHHRWARQYAIAILGQYAAHAHRAIPTLEAELARNNKDTLSFATEALDRVRGYCPDLPIDKLQGEWEFVSMQKPEGPSPFFDLQASSDQQPSSVITISGTLLKLGDRVLAELSHYRSGSRQGVALLLDPDGKKRHCHGGHNFKGGSSPEYKSNATPAPKLLILEVSELLNNLDATQANKQVYEFRLVKVETRH